MNKDNVMTFLISIGAGLLVSGILVIVLALTIGSGGKKPQSTRVLQGTTLEALTDKSLHVSPKTKTLYNLRIPSDQVVVLAGEIAEDAVNVAGKITEAAERGKEVYLLISSPGGSVMDGALIINAIEAANVPVHTVCMTYCASMAAIIHQYGTERMMQDRSFLMFHDAAGQVTGYLPHMEAQLSMVSRYVLKFDAYIAKRAGLKLDDFVATNHKNLWIDGEDSTDKKFNDRLVYVQVLDTNKKALNLRELLKAPVPTKANNPNTTTLPQMPSLTN